ncbi:hypothetical protein RIF29_30608 [Crotalaria pallida]|uniref:Uncharacterized protein n=1 Tax=Crotalaria pallida TaxID=3830 RepID=A0AAN9EGC7_CROPI
MEGIGITKPLRKLKIKGRRLTFGEEGASSREILQLSGEKTTRGGCKRRQRFWRVAARFSVFLLKWELEKTEREHEGKMRT